MARNLMVNVIRSRQSSEPTSKGEALARERVGAHPVDSQLKDVR
jgi:hypothetical protein